jgi:hypothetical protein
MITDSHTFQTAIGPRSRGGAENGRGEIILATDRAPMNTDKRRFFIGENRCPIGGSIQISSSPRQVSSSL